MDHRYVDTCRYRYHCSCVYNRYVDTFPNPTSADEIMATYVTTRRPHTGYIDSPIPYTLEYVFPQNIEYFFSSEYWIFLFLRTLNISSLRILKISFLRVLNISWLTGGWIYGQLSMAGQQLSSLYIGPGHPCRRSANGCQCKCYGRIIQIHAPVHFTFKCMCRSRTNTYALCTHTTRGYTKYSFHLISNRWQNYHWADIWHTHAIFSDNRLFTG